MALRTRRADELAADLAASGEADAYDGARACFARGDFERAERLAKRAVKMNPEAAVPLALLAWLEAGKPANASLEETRKRIVMLDRAIRADETMEHAHYWRAMLHKRLDNHNAAMSSFRKVVELNPKNMDAVRELRVYEMRIRRNSLTMKAVKGASHPGARPPSRAAMGPVTVVCARLSRRRAPSARRGPPSAASQPCPLLSFGALARGR